MRTTGVSLLLAFFAGCYTVDLPERLPDAEEAMLATTGSWIVLYDSTKLVPSAKHEGEFIAISNDSVFLFSASGLQGIQKQRISIGKLFVSDPPVTTGGLVAWVMLGTLSTASHGVGLVFTAPAWLIIGSISAGAAASSIDAGDLQYPARTWAELTAFARFPQGFPPGLDRSLLKKRVGFEEK